MQMHDIVPAGEIWKSLDPWDPSRGDVLEGITIDFNSLFDQWAPLAQPVAPMVVVNHLLLDARRMQNLEIVVRGTGLTPDLIQRGLTENFDTLSQEQAHALHTEVAPTLAEVQGRLQTVVQRGGVAGLSRVEAVLWALESVPQGSLMARFADSYFTLPETVSFACTPVHELRALRDELELSKPLRTVLQICMIALNVLSQKGNRCLRIEMLNSLSSRKLHPNQPSILRLVARDLQRTHETRCRLRFMRVFAVGKVPVTSHIKKKVWSYLDDLEESPWDVIETLSKCSSSDLNAWEETLHSSRRACSNLKQDFTRLIVVESSSNSCINQQLRRLQEHTDQAIDDMSECLTNLPEMATGLVEFFEGRQGNLELCTRLLDSLAHFGARLQFEKAVIDRNSKRCSSASWHRGSAWGTWEAVDTTEIALRNTADPDLIRSLKGPQPTTVQKSQGDDVSDQKDKDDKKQQVTSACEPKLAHLLHGGADGEYRRCETTGKWIPVGLAAHIAERDRGTRGATAGFFVTY
jgi:hypothetical protein